MYYGHIKDNPLVFGCIHQKGRGYACDIYCNGKLLFTKSFTEIDKLLKCKGNSVNWFYNNDFLASKYIVAKDTNFVVSRILEKCHKC